MTRRQWLRCAARMGVLGAAAPILQPLARGAAAAAPMRTSMMLSAEEIWHGKGWLAQFPDPPEGWAAVLRLLKETGFDTVHWRVNEPATVGYRSALETPLQEGFPFLSAAKLDFFRYGVEYARRAGLRIVAYGKVDAEGWHTLSMGDFFTSNPHLRRVARDGKRYTSNLGWAFPEVLEYKLGLVREWLEYRPDGVALAFDTMGLPADRFIDADGVALEGYEAPAVDGFRARFGRDPLQISNSDPDWIRYRMGFKTAFVQGVRQMIDADFPGVKLYVYVPAPDQTLFHYKPAAGREQAVAIHDPRPARLLDYDTWAAAKLVDGFCFHHIHDPHFRKGERGPVERDTANRPSTPAEVTERVRWFHDRVQGEAEICVSMYSYGITPERMTANVAAARRAGAAEVIVDEFSPIQNAGLWPAMRRALLAAKGGA